MSVEKRIDSGESADFDEALMEYQCVWYIPVLYYALSRYTLTYIIQIKNWIHV